MSELHTTFLSSIASQSVEEVHQHGFFYFHHGIVPRLLEAGKIKGFDRTVLGSCWNKLACSYAMNGAPKRAIECLKKARALLPFDNEVLQNIIHQQILIGAFHDAFANIDKAIDHDSDNFFLITLRQRIQDDIVYDSEPFYGIDDQVWLLKEQLASEQFETVINSVLDTDMNNVSLLKCLACAFGATGHLANYQQVWDTILRIDGDTVLEPIDLFYRPEELK